MWIKRVLAFFLTTVLLVAVSESGSKRVWSTSGNLTQANTEVSSDDAEYTDGSIETQAPTETTEQPGESQTSVPETETVPNPFAGKKVTQDEEFKQTPEKEKEDPQKGREDLPKEEIKDTIDVPSPPPPTTGPSTTVPTTAPTTSTTQGGTTTTRPETTTTTTPPTTQSPTPPIGLPDGWHTYNGNQFLYVKGSPVTGWQTISARKYYFNAIGALSSKVGVDVSTFQGIEYVGANINWPAVKADGVDFAMIRVGARGHGEAGSMWIDSQFVYNIKNATAAGVDCGVYFFSQARTKAEAVEEAQLVLNAVQGYKLTYPIAFDVENDQGRTKGMTRQQLTDVCIAFCETIKKAGYYPMIYSSKSWLTDKLYLSQLSNYDTWLANWVNNTTYSYPFQIWQYSDSGSVSGIRGPVDMNVCTFDYPSYLKSHGWNHLS